MDKTITYFYVNPDDVGKESLTITGEEAKHILSVCRHKTGDVIFVVDGKGKKYEVEILSVEKNKVEGRILSSTENENEPDVIVCLAQSIGKGTKMDLVIEKGTEIGVSCFIPLLTQRTNVKIGSEEKERVKIERWKRKALSSMKQCLRSRLPEVKKATSFDELLSHVKDYDLVLFGSLEPACPSGGAKRVKDLADLKKPLKKILLIVGPEAGFTSDELEKLSDSGAVPVNLGKRRLRTETAGIVFSAVVLGEVEG